MSRPSRIPPAEPPFPPAVAERLASIMPPGVPPLTLFRILACDERLFARFMGGGLLDKGHLTLRQREIVIDRTTARCGAEYEWGVHVSFFAERAGLDRAQVHALVHGDEASPCWSQEDALLVAFSDSLHETADIGDPLWERLAAHFSPQAIIELLLLAGFYRTVSCLVNALRIPREPYAATFPAAAPA
ncbi:MAG: carboxymuconolactone decarboxylase family protein [Hyphomicrobiaceae bacterium]|nr:carboxymuconolactone decarboxylase family protein [Hyphomicrobiaceae bacterium]